MVVIRLIWSPRRRPNVTAGLTWPPEMLAPTETATNRANPWQTATATSPAGSKAAEDVILSAENDTKVVELIQT